MSVTFRSFTCTLLPFLLLLFVGTVCGAMIVAYMGFIIINGPGHEPWKINIHAGLVSCLTIQVNRNFAGRMDGGPMPFRPRSRRRRLCFACPWHIR
ncbi:hypothetical protein [Ruegeria hyattellae]|uniref:hypothetical protein n=1 Tax=Ruegeria hyattellae TaxID=3233337 RepID=UPI00355C33A4